MTAWNKSKSMVLANCYAFKPQVGKGKVFNQDYPQSGYQQTVSGPMLIEARMKVGRIKMELLKAQ